MLRRTFLRMIGLAPLAPLAGKAATSADLKDLGEVYTSDPADEIVIETLELRREATIDWVYYVDDVIVGTWQIPFDPATEMTFSADPGPDADWMDAAAYFSRRDGVTTRFFWTR